MKLEEAARRLNRTGIRWAVFAGGAAKAYGATRPLTDVDILVPAAEAVRAEALFPEARVSQYEDGRQGLLLPGIDILAGLALMDLDEEMAVRLTSYEIAGISVPVIPAEDNILLKATWGRGPDEGKHDWEDVEAMMTCLDSLDWEYLFWRAEGLPPRPQVQRVLQRLEQLWEQMKNA